MGLASSADQLTAARYRAFLSYASHDREIGKKFQNRLETYRLPQSLRARAGGKRLGRIFRDRSDLTASTDLGATLQQNLRRSESLIVLCSPTAAASTWVNQEITYFRGLGREDKIISVLVSGAPKKWDENSCPEGAFPPALFAGGSETEPFSPDLRDPALGGDGLEMAMLKVVSRLINVPLDEVTERHIAMVRADRRRARNILALVSTLAVGATVAAAVAWMQTQVANQRLADVLSSASGQVQLASQLRDRYGVPSSVSREFYDLARTDFEKIEQDVGDHPALLLEKGRFAMGMAAFSQDMGHTNEREASLQRAKDNFDKLALFQNSLIRHFVPLRPDPEETARARQWLGAEIAQLQVSRGKGEVALLSIQEALEDAEAYPKTAAWQRQVASLQCSLADIQYRISRYSDASRAYESCLGTYAALPTGSQTVQDAQNVIDAATQLGMIARAQNAPGQALSAHEDALRKAKDLARQFGSASDLQRQVALTYGMLGDSQLGAGRSPQEAAASYAAGREISAVLIASDPTRRDWQRDHMLLLERGVQAILATLPDLRSSEWEAAFATASGFLDEMEALSERFRAIDPQDTDQAFLHSVLLERRAIVALTRAKYTGATGDMTPFADIDAAVDLRKTIAAQQPNKISAQYNLAAIQQMAGRIYAALSENPADGLRYYDSAQSGIKKLIDAQVPESQSGNLDPDNWVYELALLHYLRATLYHKIGNISEAIAEVDEAQVLVSDLLNRHTDVPRYKAAFKDLATLKEAITSTP